MDWNWEEERLKSQDKQYFASLLADNPQKYELIRKAALENNENAVRTLGNILFHNQQARQSLPSCPEFPSFRDHFIRLFDSNQVNNLDFVFWRLFFLVTIETETVRLFLPIVNESLSSSSSFHISQYSENIVIEILRVMYNISRIECSDYITSLALNSIKAFPSSLSVIGNSYNVLLNASNYDNLTIDCLLSSITLFAESMKLSEQDVVMRTNLSDYIPSFFLVSLAIIRQDNLKRAQLRKAILPSNRGSSKLKNLFRYCLQNSNDRLTKTCGDFLFALLKESLGRLVYHFGYGVLAGYLYSRNMIAAINEETLADNLGESSDEEAIKSGALNHVNIVTGLDKTHDHHDNDHMDVVMTEEEKDAENERLFKLFERLDKISK